jgi:predicted HicB family RNase H-like nuclease
MIDKYCYTVSWSEEDEAYIGRVSELPSLAAHGDTRETALQEISQLVEYVLKDLEESGEAIPEPFATRQFSGRFNVRIGKSLHRALAVEASRQGISLNQLVIQKLARFTPDHQSM